MKPVRFYEPVERGLEAKIREKLAHLRQLDAETGEKPE
jgi:putative ATPase